MTLNPAFAAARETFFAESREMLQTMEDALLALENAPDDAETINALFRAAHTIKGSAGLFELERIVGFTHTIENVLDRARSGTLALTPDLLTLLLRCCDQIGALLAEASEGEASEGALANNDEQSAALTRSLKDFLNEAPVPPPARPESGEVQKTAHAATGGSAETVQTDHWHISVRFGRDVLRNGMDPLSIVRYLCTLGKILNIQTLFDAMPEAEDMDPETCYLGFEIALQSEATRQDIAEAFDFVREDCSLRILPPHSKIAEYVALIQALPEDVLRLGEILVRCGSVTQDEMERGLASQREQIENSPPPAQPLGEILMEQSAIEAPVLNAALEKQQRTKEKQQQESLFVRVRADKLDRLINLVGELVVAGAGAALRAQRSGDVAMFEATQTMSHLVEQIRDDALQLRMVQIAETFNRFNRVVRDTSKELGKDVVLEIAGAENELDKSMVEKLVDPLMHLVRNAIDHGIETPSVRRATGKPEQGTVLLAARHDSGSFIIEVSDDGAGLDRQRILAKAIARGLVQPGKELSEAEVFQFIFMAGFSTVEQVTNLSGRGVGMDVVRRNVEALRGSVTVDSRPGAGTRFTMRLPLTLAIIDGFLVQVGPAQYVIPLDLVVECVELSADTKARTHGRNYINLRGEVLPFLRLRELFGITGEPPPRENVVVVQYAGQRAGLVVDMLLGEFQTVIKPLSKLFKQLQGISGSTILGSGEVALILDVPALVRRATQREESLASH